MKKKFNVVVKFTESNEEPSFVVLAEDIHEAIQLMKDRLAPLGEYTLYIVPAAEGL